MVTYAIVQQAPESAQQSAQTGPREMTQQEFRQQLQLEKARNPRWGEALAGSLVPLGSFAFVLVIVWLNNRRKQLQIQATAELQKQLLDKFGSGRELSDFLETAAGRNFIDQFSQRGRVRGRDTVLNGMRGGIITASIGFGFLGLWWMRHRGDELLVPAIILLSLGAGITLASCISRYLMKKWGANNGSGEGPTPAL